MKKYLNPHSLPLFSVLLGVFTSFARLWLQRGGVDEKGLYIAGHPGGVLSMIAIPVFLVVLYLCTHPMAGLPHPLPARLSQKQSGILGILSTVFLFLHGIMLFTEPLDTLGMVYAGMTFVCAVCFLWLALCRLKGIRPHYLFYVVITAYLILHLLRQYRMWSAEPQIFAFFFQLMASVMLMLFAYQCACRRDGGSTRWYALFHQCALFFSIAAMDNIRFYYIMALWLVTEQFGWKPSQEADSHETS